MYTPASTGRMGFWDMCHDKNSWSVTKPCPYIEAWRGISHNYSTKAFGPEPIRADLIELIDEYIVQTLTQILNWKFISSFKWLDLNHIYFSHKIKLFILWEIYFEMRDLFYGRIYFSHKIYSTWSQIISREKFSCREEKRTREALLYMSI